MARTAQQIVDAEVYARVSSLVATLAAGVYIESDWLKHDHGARTAIHNLFAAAAELAAPIHDWEEAASQHGLQLEKAGDQFLVVSPPAGSDMSITRYDDERNAAIAYCDFYGLDPLPREVYEHWIVSDWLAGKLEAKGEKVDRDFADLIIWARTTTGQAIYADSVIEAIAADLNRGG